MQILDIVLAFALLLVVFSSIASAITELILRTIRFRSSNLKSSVYLFSRDVIWPIYEDLVVDRLHEGEQNGVEKDRVLKELSEELTRNPTAEADAISDESFSLSAFLGKLSLKIFPGVSSIDKLSTEAFVQRFANTTAGSKFAGEGARLKSITLAFERYMATSQERYRKRAGIAAMLVSIAFAAAANIQFGELIAYLRDNPAAVESIIADGDEIVRRSKVATEASDAEEFQKSVETLSMQLEVVRDDYQLPIGWGIADIEESSSLEWPLTWVVWFINVLIAGVLIGLGAPFWYAVVKNVGQARIVAGAISREDREMISASAKDYEPDNTMESHQAHVDLFNSAARSKKPTFVDDNPPPIG